MYVCMYVYAYICICMHVCTVLESSSYSLHTYTYIYTYIYDVYELTHKFDFRAHAKPETSIHMTHLLILFFLFFRTCRPYSR